MTIKPSDLSKIREEEKNDIKTLEKRIDESILLQSKFGKTSYEFSVDIFPNVKVRKEIIRIYREAGWKVNLIDDFKEGDYVLIEKKK